MSLMNTQYDSIMRMYAARQARSRQEYEARMEQIQKDIPELSALEADITTCQAALVRSAVEDAPSRRDGLKSHLKALQEQRSALLSAHGLTPEALKPVYVCPDCQDTGFIGAEKCHCFLQAEIDLLYHQSNLNEVLKQENFDTFSYNWYDGDDRDSMRRTVAEARLFIENFDKQFQNLLLLGAVGTGKTFLSNCIAKELMDSCHSVVYLTAFQLFDMLSKAAFGGERSAQNYQQTYPYLFDCDLLIIDDLGTELPNSFTVSQFFLCINERILRKKSTLISSNLDMEALRSIYSERTLSRIISSYTIRQLPGSDIRIKKKLYNTNS